MPRLLPHLGILALVALSPGSWDGLLACPPQGEPNPFQEANPKPSNKKATRAEKPSVVKLSNAKAPTEGEIRKSLETPVEVRFSNQPLNAILGKLALVTKTNFKIDEQALSEEGVAINESVTLEGKPLAAARVLDRILEPLGLTWIIEDHIVQITTIIAADEKLYTVSYPVGDLVEYGKQDKPEQVEPGLAPTFGVQFGDGEMQGGFGTSGCGDMQSDYDKTSWLIDTLQQMTDGPWQDIDGTGGTISFLNNNLVIRQTQKEQQAIGNIIRTIRAFSQRNLELNPTPIRPSHYAIDEDASVKKALKKVITVKGKDVPLQTFLDDIARTLQIPISIDPQGLIEEGVSVDEPLTLDLANLPADSLLKAVFDPLGLTGIVEDGEVRVTTIIAAEERLFTKIHDVRDLNEAKYTGQALHDMLQQETSGPWEDIDGTGGTVDVPLNGLLILRQTERVHNQVEAILADLRKQLAQIPAEPEMKTAPENPEARSTKFYSLTEVTPPEAVEQAILKFVEPKSWAKNGGEGEMLIIGFQLVVRHKNEVQAKVDEFIKELNKAAFPKFGSGMGTNPPAGSGHWHQHTTPAKPQKSGGGFFQIPSSPNEL